MKLSKVTQECNSRGQMKFFTSSCSYSTFFLMQLFKINWQELPLSFFCTCFQFQILFCFAICILYTSLKNQAPYKIRHCFSWLIHFTRDHSNHYLLGHLNTHLSTYFHVKNWYLFENLTYVAMQKHQSCFFSFML